MIGPIKTIQVVAAREKQHCGVRDYALHLASAMPQESSRVVTISPSSVRVSRVRIRQLKDMRNDIARQVLALPQATLAHVQYADFSWNGTRIYEDLYELFSRKCRLPLVLTLHEHPWFRDEHETDRARTLADGVFARLAGYRRLPSSLPLEILQRHRGIHVHHRWQKDALIRNGLAPSCVTIIPLSVPSCATSSDQVGAFRRKFGLDKKRIITVVGFIFERKRYDRLLELLRRLPADAVICALGGTNGAPSERYLNVLKKQALTLGVADRFVVTGYLPEGEMEAGMHAADLFAAPYGEVTSSASVARCIGAGAPVLAADCPTFAELESDGAGLIVVDPQDQSEMVRRATELLEKGAQYQVLRQRNLHYAADWSRVRVAAELRAWYEVCLK